LALQLLTYVVSPMSTDWFSRIFPFALAYFMAGSLAYRAYLWVISRADNASARPAVNRYMLGSCLTLVLLTVFFDYLPLGRAIYLTATTLCLPGIVIAGRRIPIDGFLGDLSYPIYLVHPIFMIVVIAGNNPIGIPTEAFPIAGSLLISLALDYFVERPIDRYRQARVGKGDGVASSAALPIDPMAH
jgi:peptidoglycan/LPS O-acetylase OafA/YrhL